MASLNDFVAADSATKSGRLGFVLNALFCTGWLVFGFSANTTCLAAYPHQTPIADTAVYQANHVV